MTLATDSKQADSTESRSTLPSRMQDAIDEAMGAAASMETERTEKDREDAAPQGPRGPGEEHRHLGHRDHRAGPRTPRSSRSHAWTDRAGCYLTLWSAPGSPWNERPSWSTG